MSSIWIRKQPFGFFQALILAGVIFLGMLSIVLLLPEDNTRLAITDGLYPLINLVATLALFYAARRSAHLSRRLGLAWKVLALAQLSYTLGDLVWGILEAGLHVRPFPSWADIGYLGYYPLFLLGILLLPGPHLSLRKWLEMTLDLSIVMLTAILWFWNHLIGPLALSGNGDPWLNQALSLAYPVGDLVLFWALLTLLYRRSSGQHRGPIYLLAGALLVMIVTDGAYGFESLSGSYQSGGLLDMGYVLVMLLTLLASLLQVEDLRSEEGTPPSSSKTLALTSRAPAWLSYFPYLWVALSFLLLVQSTYTAFPMSSGQIAIWVGGIIALMLARQIVALTENSRLNSQTEHHLQRLTILRAIDRAILASPDLGSTLDILAEQITAHLGVDATSILIHQPVSQTLETTALRGLQGSIYRNTILRIGESHAGRVALERKLEVIPDLSQIEDSMTARIRQSGERFVGYAALPLIAKGEVKGVLQLFQRSRLDPRPDWLDFLQALADQAAIAIDNAQMYDQELRANINLRLAYDGTIDGWSRALDLRDKETEGHSQRVTELTLQLALRLGVPEEQIPSIRWGAQLHDIGKMGIPDSILLKPGPLTDEEWALMHQHPQYAYDLLRPIQYLSSALDIPYCHHEHWDGGGYPRGLKGEAIPLSARIFAVVDVWDALCNDRPYRPAWPKEKATRYIQEQAGSHFDPRVAAAFLDLVQREGTG